MLCMSSEGILVNFFKGKPPSSRRTIANGTIHRTQSSNSACFKAAGTQVSERQIRKEAVNNSQKRCDIRNKKTSRDNLKQTAQEEDKNNMLGRAKRLTWNILYQFQRREVKESGSSKDAVRILQTLNIQHAQIQQLKPEQKIKNISSTVFSAPT